jgi:hypothetical protein
MRRPFLPAIVFAASLAGGAARAATDGPLYDPAQLPAVTGVVQHFLLTPRGDIDGLLLADGTEVRLPPHLSVEIAYAVKLGDTVTVHGLRAAALPLIAAASVTDAASGRTVVDRGPPGKGPRPPAGPGAGAMLEVSGKVRQPLHGPQGEVNGALLEDGTVLRLPPPEAARYQSLLAPGTTLVARGRGIANDLGRVVEVAAIGPSADQLAEVPVPHGPGGRPGKPRPPGPGAGPDRPAPPPPDADRR